MTSVRACTAQLASEMAKEVMVIMLRCNDDLGKADSSRVARDVWEAMKPLENRIKDCMAMYGNATQNV